MSYKSPSHRHGSPRTERGESTGPKPSKTTTTYVMTFEFTLEQPANYRYLTDELRHAVLETIRTTPFQVSNDGPFFNKKPEVKDG